MIFKTCEICGEPFKTKASHLSRRKTCSRICLRIYKSKTFSGEGNHQFGLKGKLNSSFKSEITERNGYQFIYKPDHPYSDTCGRLRYHRYVAENYLLIPEKYLDKDGYLLPEIDVHHIDGNTLNNDPSNLEILPRGEHTTKHNQMKVIHRDCNNGRIIGVSKRGELLESCDANQQPSLNRNVLEGSTTNSRVLPDNAEDSKADTSALH